MKTTLEIDDALLLAAKQQALDEQTSLRNIVERALSQLLQKSSAAVVDIKTVTFPAKIKPSQKTSIPSAAELQAAAYPHLATKRLEVAYQLADRLKSGQGKKRP